MKALIIGGGGREHAITRKIHDQHPEVELFAAPGNPGIGEIAECVPIQAMDLDGLLTFALKERIDLTVVGPEAPLAAGIRDRFSEAGLKLFGPRQAAAQIEADKEFALALMHKHDVPTGWYRIFTDAKDAFDFAECKGCPLVLKNPYLVGGKGSFVCFNLQDVQSALRDIQSQQQNIASGNRFLIMQYLQGQEVSITAITDGVDVVYLAPAQDHKRLLDGDQGPMTGGMGAIAPAPFVTPDLQVEIHEKIILPTIRAMAAAGRPYSGVLYAGLILTALGPKVLEFNCRFGDPETQVILPILEADLLEIMLATGAGGLQGIKIPSPRRAAACIVLAAKNYGYGPPETGRLILGLENLVHWRDVIVFQSGTRGRATDKEQLETASGRVLGIVGLDVDLASAVARSNRAVERVYFDDRQRRRDIGHRALTYLEKEGKS